MSAGYYRQGLPNRVRSDFQVRARELLAKYDAKYGGELLAKYDTDNGKEEPMDYVTSYMGKVAKADDRHAAAKAAEVVKGALQALTDRGMPYGVAVDKLRRLDLTPDELQKLARKVRQPKVRYDSNGSGSASNDDDADDKESPDAQLSKLGEAVKRVNPTFTKAQAEVWAAEHTDVGREAMRLSKRQSISRYGEQAAGHLDKAESLVSSAPLPNIAFGKMSDAALTALFREGRFDKLGGHSVPRPAHGPQGTHTNENRRSWQHSGRDGSHSQENARPVRDQSAVANTDPPSPPRVVRLPEDAAAFASGDERIADGRRTPDQGTFSDRVKQLQNSGLNFDQASTQAMRERGNPDAISP
jgi:hypothetical protein